MGKVLAKKSSTALYLTLKDNEPFSDITKEQIALYLSSKNLRRDWTLIQTEQGLLVKCSHFSDAKTIEKLSFPKEIGVKSVTLLPRQKPSTYKRGLYLSGIPCDVPIEDIKAALIRQGVVGASVERTTNFCRVEVHQPQHYEELFNNGLNFFGVSSFLAVPADCSNTGVVPRNGKTLLAKSNSDFMFQCYRCQGWWHTSENCRYEMRCVRCGGHHNLSVCPTPRSQPICCHCSGPHCASYKLCPVRLSLINALPISMSLTSKQSGVS